MADLIKTDWFDSDVVPAQFGVYEREFFAGPAFSLWDGAAWSVLARTPEAAAAVTTVSGIQHRRWRGIVPEVHGCVPVSQDAAHGCCGCAFEKNLRACEASINAIRCDLERIIWRPRAEVAP